MKTNPSTPNMSLLIVDDEVDVCRYLSTLLQSAGIDSAVATDGVCAIEALSALSPGRGCGKESKAQSTMVETRMIVPARFRKIIARCQRPNASARIWGS